MAKGNKKHEAKQKSGGVVKYNQDESSDQDGQRSEESSDERPKKKEKVIKKTQPKNKIKHRSSSSEKSSKGYKSESEAKSSQSEAEGESDEDRRKYKRNQKGIGKYLDIFAEQKSGQESSSLSDSQFQLDHKQKKEQIEKRYKLNEKPETEKFFERINRLKDEDINRHYDDLEKQQRSMDLQEESDFGRDDIDLYQLKCIAGMEEELVGCILNKCRYARQHPEHYFCEITAAVCMPKRFPGYIFLEGESYTDLRKSLDGFKFLKVTSLKKIEFELFSTLFNPQPKPRHQFKLQQYVRIKTGMYRDDLAQITKTNKKGVVVQVVPRLNFADIYQRMKQIEVQYNKLNYKQSEIAKIKNTRFKEMTDPKVNYQTEGRPEKKKLTPSDFQPFAEFAHTKSIKITAQGLLLVHYAYNEIQCPKTTVSPLEVIALNRADIQKAEVLKQQAKKVKLALDVKRNDLVQIIHGELKGAYGKVYQKFIKMVRIKCQNPELRGLIIDEVNDYVQKMFREGDIVIIVEGSYKGQEGQVYRNGISSVYIMTTNKERVKILKRNVHLKMQSSITFTNDLGLQKDDIVKTRYELGIVCDVKKNYVDFVTPKNEMHRGMNNDVTKVTNYQSRALTKDREQVRRNCLVVILSGMKKERSFLVKHVYDNYLFLQDPAENNLQGNWVERGENCRLYLKIMPRIEAKFLADEGRFKQFLSYQQKPQFFPQKPLPESVMDNDEFKVGKHYLIKHGVYRGVKGVIVAAFKTHINVCVFNDKIEKIERSKLEGKSCSGGNQIINAEENPSPRYGQRIN